MNRKRNTKKIKIIHAFRNSSLKLNFHKKYSIVKAIHKKKNDSLFTKNSMPYIPNVEREKGESNFITLIKRLSNNLESIKVSNNEPYKPKGYNYYQYSIEHPELIKDSKRYIDIIKDLSNSTVQKNDVCYSYENKKAKFGQKKNSKLNIATINDTLYTNNTNITNYTNNIKTNNSKLLNYLRNINNSYSEKTTSLKAESLTKLPKIKSTVWRNNKMNIIKKKDYFKSDIFNLVDDDFSREKSGEKFLFKKNYLPSEELIEKKMDLNDVGWGPKNNAKKSGISISSVSFNIISPNIANVSPSKKELEKINNYSYLKSNVLSEYVDKCKPGDSYLRKSYVKNYERNRNIFHKKNYCASYCDLHHEYKGLILDVF
jgi:hypothetical protein